MSSTVRKLQADGPPDPVYVKHWIGVQLKTSALIQCIKVTQPHLYAVDEIKVFGCDKSAVFRLGIGQVLRRPEKVCSGMVATAIEFGDGATSAIASAAAAADNENAAALAALSSGATVKDPTDYSP